MGSIPPGGDEGGIGKPEDGTSPHRRPPMPRWVKVFALVFAAVVLALVAVAILSGGEHSPGRHLGAPAAPHATVWADR